ncbi:hypothetical protein N9Y42_10220 [Mariniblastus sp.]|nr:hypothetical protein [Mariniblastus sp.]
MRVKKTYFGILALASLLLCGCPATDTFHGRLILRNNTDSTVEGITVSLVLPSGKVQEVIPTFELEPGQAVVFDNEIGLFICPFIRVVRDEAGGEPVTLDVPFEGFVPGPCHDDLWLQFSPSGVISVQIMQYGKSGNSSKPRPTNQPQQELSKSLSV